MKKESYTHVRPTVTGIVVKNRTYIGLSEKAKEKMKEEPYFKNLFVNTEDLLKARQSLMDPNSVINVSYQQVLRDL